jgi:diguanylate cyclase (GGDEF)-like protein/PAS domain S-box-containing protein
MRLKQIHFNLREKLLIVVISGVLIAFGMLGVFRLYQAKTSITNEITRSGQERALLIAESLSNLMVAYDYSNIESLAERIVKMQDVQQINILNRSGKSMVSRASKDFDPKINNLVFTAPIYFASDKIGSVELVVSLQRIQQSVSDTSRNIILLLIVFAFFVGGLIYATMSIFIVTPLSRLSKAADQLALGDFSAVLPPETRDELGHLVRAFTFMRESRKKTELELNSLNASLETIVMARIGELRDSEAYIHAVLENVNEGIIVVEEAGAIISFNAAAEKIFGYNSQEISHQKFNLLISADHLEITGQYHKFSQEEVREGAQFGVTREVVGLRKDFSAFPLELKTTQLHIQNKLLFITTARDITERKDAEQRISYMASHDALTTLPNRALLQDRIEQTLVHNHRRKLKAAVLFIDLDKFKIINDTLGHDIGDGLLQAAAARLVAGVRGEDTVARQGGDEFIILLSHINSPEDAGIISHKLQSALAEPFLIKGKELHIGASIGIAIYPDDGENMETLMKNSDIAMYHAKESGRGNYQYFSSKLNEQAAEKQALNNDLRHAIERNELFLAYQPVIDMLSGNITGMEVLLRWKHPEHGLVSPVKFIPLAEESGQILSIGDWVLKTACEQLQAWLKQGYEVPRLAINLSAKQFRQKTLAEDINNVLKMTGTDPRYIGIEITESMLVQNIEEVVITLLNLSNMGLEISIDDFGTGYSSLSYLKRFPINKLKIDKSFVDDIATHPDDAAIVKAIIAMAHGLSMKVVTEGVETQAQLDFLREHGCEQYQGYIFSKPLPAAEIVTKLQPQKLSS